MIFQMPIRSGIRWTDVESLIRACGGDIEERAGSRKGIWLTESVPASTDHIP